jgi:hypothetical protein
LSLALLLCGLIFALAGSAQASKVVYFSFGAKGTLGGQFETPRDMAVNRTGAGPANPGDLYLVDEANNRIQRFDEEGNFISAWGADAATPEGGTNYEVCTAAAGNCKAGVASAGNGAVAGDGTFSKPQSVAVDNDTGNVFVSDRENRRVSEYDGAGVFIRSFGFDVDATTPATTYEVCPATDVCKVGVSGAGIGQYGAGTTAGTFGITVSQADGNAATGTVFLADSGNKRVDTFNLDGTLPASFGSASNFGANQPRKIAVDSRGIVYASDSNNNGEIDRYDSLNANGGGVGFVASIASPPLLAGTAASATAGIAVDPDLDGAGPETDVLYVLRVPTEGSAVVQQFGPAHPPGLTVAPTTADDQHGASAGLTSANGLAINDAKGSLYVTSTANEAQRVYVLTDPPSHLPVVVTGGANNGAAYYVKNLEGTVNPAEYRVSDCHFEYGTTTGYGTNLPCAPEAGKLGHGAAAVEVGVSTGLLEPSTTYHYRLVASNAGGTSNGEDRVFTTAAAPIDNCPNAAIRAEQGIRALVLPDCMAFEQVSPTKKFGAPASVPLLSPDGDRAFFKAESALADAPGLPFIAFYVATRGPSGWTTKSALPPKEYCCGGGVGTDPLVFAPDFSHWINAPATTEQASRASAQAFVEGIDGIRSPLSPNFGAYEGSAAVPVEVVAAGAAANLSHLFFYIEGAPNPILAPGDPLVSEGSGFATYDAHLNGSGEPSVSLLSRDASGKVWAGGCGSRIGGPRAFGINTAVQDQGAVSADGSSVYFTTNPGAPSSGACNRAVNRTRILRRIETPAGPQITNPVVSECSRISPPCDTTDGDDEFQAASFEGTKLFFTTTRQLASSDLDTGTACNLNRNVLSSAGCDLYMYDYARPLGERLTQVSAGAASDPERGKNAEVLGVMAISGDGSHSYFVAKAVLTTVPNQSGKVAELGKPNLYLYERDAAYPAGRTVFIATMQGATAQEPCNSPAQSSLADCARWDGPSHDFAQAVPLVGSDPGDNSVGGDGHILAFVTRKALSGEDLDGEQADIYRYDADSSSLQMISNGALGGHSNGSAPVTPAGGSLAGGNLAAPMGSNIAQQNRWVGEDGNTIAFFTNEDLVPGDVNRSKDAYVWRDGHLFTLPGPKAGTVSVSQSGDEIAFESYSSLVGLDRDSTGDAYVARSEGGYPTPVEPPPCQAEACQGPAGAQPGDQAAASGSVTGAGNVKEKPRPHRHKRHRKHKRHAGHGRGGQK